MKTDGGTSTFAGIYQYDRLNRLRYSKRAEWSGSAFLAPTDKLASEYRYDPNGNIQALRRAVEREQSGVFANFDEFRYDYTGGTNKLSLLHDSSAVRFAPDGTASSASNPNNTDITGTRAYLYDEAGNVRSDAGRTITWTPYGKVETVQKETGAGEVRFIYDAQGNRVLKEETGAGGAVNKRTWYVRDAAGQHLTTYEQSGGSGTPRAKEYLLYGSTRLGTAYADNANGGVPVSGALYRRVVGQKQYELGDHLGNVRATVGDVKVRSGSTFAARVESHTEYFPFGMVASTATVAGGVGGRFGFNGHENDYEIIANGGYLSFGGYGYDPRTALRFNVEPNIDKYPNFSSYLVFGNNPIVNLDPDGNDKVYFNWDGTEEYREKSNTEFRTYIKSGRASHPQVSLLNWTEVPMPKIINERVQTNESTSSPKYQSHDYLIAAQVGYFNQDKNRGTLKLYSDGGNAIPTDVVLRIPDLDPTLVKAVAMQESHMGFGSNPTSDIMQVNNPGDWTDVKALFTLKKDVIPNETRSLFAGIRFLAAKGFKENIKSDKKSGKLVYKFSWENGVHFYNSSKGTRGYANFVETMRDNATTPQPSDYVTKRE